MNKAIEEYIGQIRNLKKEANKTLLERVSNNLSKNGFNTSTVDKKLQLDLHSENLSYLIIEFDDTEENIKNVTTIETNCDNCK